jgi:8-oxo-dGTP pyrophosphatase MutT (NUDIX family)
VINLSSDWQQSYVGQLRKYVGNQKLIVPSIRAYIQDQYGGVLLIRRRGSGKWAMPAGGIEYDESIFECLRREVYEETGLSVIKATLIAIYSEPRFIVKNTYGDEYQGFELLFRVDQWKGETVEETNETKGIGFYNLNNLPELEPGYWEEHHKEIVQDIFDFNGITILK